MCTYCAKVFHAFESVIHCFLCISPCFSRPQGLTTPCLTGAGPRAAPLTCWTSWRSPSLVWGPTTTSTPSTGSVRNARTARDTGRWGHKVGTVEHYFHGSACFWFRKFHIRPSSANMLCCKGNCVKKEKRKNWSVSLSSQQFWSRLCIVLKHKLSATSWLNEPEWRETH